MHYLTSYRPDEGETPLTPSQLFGPNGLGYNAGYNAGLVKAYRGQSVKLKYYHSVRPFVRSVSATAGASAKLRINGAAPSPLMTYPNISMASNGVSTLVTPNGNGIYYTIYQVDDTPFDNFKEFGNTFRFRLDNFSGNFFGANSTFSLRCNAGAAGDYSIGEKFRVIFDGLLIQAQYYSGGTWTSYGVTGLVINSDTSFDIAGDDNSISAYLNVPEGEELDEGYAIGGFPRTYRLEWQGGNGGMSISSSANTALATELTLTVPSDTAFGTYYIRAYGDDGNYSLVPVYVCSSETGINEDYVFPNAWYIGQQLGLPKFAYVHHSSPSIINIITSATEADLMDGSAQNEDFQANGSLEPIDVEVSGDTLGLTFSNPFSVGQTVTLDYTKSSRVISTSGSYAGLTLESFTGLAVENHYFTATLVLVQSGLDLIVTMSDNSAIPLFATTADWDFLYVVGGTPHYISEDDFITTGNLGSTSIRFTPNEATFPNGSLFIRINTSGHDSFVLNSNSITYAN